jgi:ketosteroid isomerase-like protein
MTSLTAVVVSMVVLAVPVVGRSQCTEAEVDALTALDKAWNDAGVRGDNAFLEGLYSPKFASHSPLGLIPRSAEITRVTAGVRDPSARFTDVFNDHYVVSCTGGTATLSHRTGGTTSAGEKLVGRALHFFERSNGKWQVVSSTLHLLSDEDQLTYMELDWNDASKAHDAAWVEKNFAPFSIEISSRTGSIDGKAQSVESMKTDKRVFESLEMSDLSVRVEGEAAVVTGVNHAIGKDAAGKPMDRRIRFTDTFIKRDGRWQVWASQGTLIQ